MPDILEHDGYKEVDYKDRQQGDKVIYTSENDNVEDSRTVQADVDKVWGQGGLETSDYESDIESTWTKPNENVKARIYRKTTEDVQLGSAQEVQDFVNKQMSHTPFSGKFMGTKNKQ